ncbi:hypothetical protein [Cystobacter fuscus]|uniref:hypothetical protein n=1 Tax=Cystobacter fuscus TaxID=43 RepID=UPI002B286EAC|nr:hypothetical protein F0U63_29400 [Cystobacter fuscus]
MMGNDDEQLQEELHWTPGKKSPWRSTPRGATAIMAMGGVLMLAMWGVTMTLVGSARDLAAVGVFLVMGLEGLVALGIARSLWRAMGPVARGIIRPLMVLGPLPPLAVLCCTSLALVQALNPQAGFVSRGKNWGIPLRGGSVRFSEVQALCSKLGSQWRIPSEDEVARLDPPPPVGRNSTHTNYWLLPAPGTSPAEDVFLAVSCLGPRCSTDILRQARRPSGDGENAGAALCVNF